MMDRRMFLWLLPVAVGVAACSSAEEAGTEVGQASAGSGQDAPANGETLDVNAFAEAMTQPGTTIIDVRTPEEYEAGHIEDAVNIDIGSPNFTQRLRALDPSAPYAVYCQSANRSGMALQAMKRLGFERVYHLDGGIGAWQSAGRDVVRS